MKGIVESHVTSLLNKDVRLDGRKIDEFRKIEIEYGISPATAEGSARVKVGNTEVIAGVKMEVGKPYPDKPNEGSIIANVELLPLSSPDFEPGPPRIEAIEMARAIVDRGIRESDALDFKSLCIEKGEKMWIVIIDVYSINDDGNLSDAIGIATLAALRDAKFPKYDAKNDMINYEEKTTKKLNLKELPIPITVLKINGKYLLDPTLEEESSMDARLTVTSVEDGRICALQKGGDTPLTSEDVKKMVEMSIRKGKEIRKLFKSGKK